jgi:hypothetical protein
MPTNLATLSLGGVGGFYPWLLHTGNGVLSTGFQLETGGGIATPLFLDEGGIGVRNAGGFVGKIRYNGSSHGTYTFRKDPGEAILAANQSNSTVTGAALPSFTIPMEANKRYQISGFFICQQNSAARAVQIALTGHAASVSIMHAEMRNMKVNVLTSGDNMFFQRLSSFGSYYLPTACPLADVPYLVYVDGIIITNGTAPASPLGVEFKSSVAANVAQILAGSRLTLTEY